MMAISEAEIRSTQPTSGRLYSRPMLGLLAFSVPLIWKPVAHCVSVLSHSAMHGPVLVVGSTVLTLLGFFLVWIGFRKDELTATLLGLAGGSLIFMFGVEPSFAMFAGLMDVAPLTQDGQTFLTPNLVVMEASLVVYLVVLIFTGANKDTRCRMFLWFHRNFRLRPNKPTPGYRRQFARIAAMETVFISWFFYLFIILLVDPRLMGPTHPATYVLSFAMLAWGLYLLVFKQLKYTSMAAAIRYAIPVVGILWYFVEITAIWRWYTEIWVKPFEYPLANAALAAAFVLAVYLVNNTDARGARAAD
jgi:hypothetical protein